MASAARHVQSLRLRAPDATSLRRTVVILEDALRTASLPDAGGRLLFVRRLALGRIDSRAAPASLALKIERAMARSGAACVHGSDVAAGRAGAVWFDDALDAHLALARRVLEGAPPHEWFWPLAVPGWTAQGSRADAVRTLARSLAMRPEAPVALPQWFSALERAGHADVLRGSLRRNDLPLLAEAAGLRWNPQTRRHALKRDDADERRAIPPTGTFATHESRAHADAPHANDDVPGHAQIRRLLALMRRAVEPALFRAPAAPLKTMRASSSDRAAPRDHEDATATAALAQQRSGPALAPTCAGGALFLLNALARLGYAEWVAANPEWAAQQIARRVLAQTLARLRVEVADPAWALFDTPSPTSTPRRFVAPPRWREGLLAGCGALRLAHDEGCGALFDASGRLLLGAWRGARPRSLLGDCRSAAPMKHADTSLVDAVAQAWSIALHRWLRRYARIGLASLVLRPARFAATPTHLDLWFDHRHADLRIRRAGLDLDPGWLPWFGRVVRFHYDRGLDA